MSDDSTHTTIINHLLEKMLFIFAGVTGKYVYRYFVTQERFLTISRSKRRAKDEKQSRFSKRKRVIMITSGKEGGRKVPMKM